MKKVSPCAARNKQTKAAKRNPLNHIITVVLLPTFIFNGLYTNHIIFIIFNQVEMFEKSEAKAEFFSSVMGRGIMMVALSIIKYRCNMIMIIMGSLSSWYWVLWESRFWWLLSFAVGTIRISLSLYKYKYDHDVFVYDDNIDYYDYNDYDFDD